MNPLAMAGEMAGIGNAVQQNILLRKTIGAQQAVGQQVQAATGADGQLDPNAFMVGVKNDPAAAYGAQGAQEFAQAQRQAQLLQQTTQLANAHAQWGVINDSVGSLLQKPNVSAKDVADGVGNLVAMNVIDAKTGAAELAGMPSSPDELPNWLRGHLVRGMQAQQQIEAMIGPQQLVDTGGQIQGVRAPTIADSSATPQPSVAPIDKTMSPGEAASPVAGFDEKTQQPVLETKGQFAQQGSMPAGPKLGAETAANVTAAGAANQGLALSHQADEARDTKALLGNLKADLGGFSAGPGAGEWKHILAGLQRLGVSIDPNMVANQENFNKVATMLAQRQFAQLGGTGTDRQLGSAIESNPNQALSNLGNERIVAMLKGNSDAIMLKNQVWQRWLQNGHSPASYNQFATEFNKAYDPRAFQMQYLSPAERKQMVSGMAPAEQAQFRSQYNAAVKRGWVPKP